MLMPRARRTCSDKEHGLQRTATIVDRLGSGSSQTEDVCSPDVRLSCRYIYLYLAAIATFDFLNALGRGAKKKLQYLLFLVLQCMHVSKIALCYSF